MKRIITWMVQAATAIALIISLPGCGGSGNSERDNSEVSDTTAVNPDPAHNSKNSVDWAGIYRGVMPCADCAGMRTELRLNGDGSYRHAVLYEGKSDSVYSHEGTFRWDETGGIIDLSGLERNFRVGENRLIQLDEAGQPVTGELAPRYVLHKAGMGITGVDWRLYEWNGAVIAGARPGSWPGFTLESGAGKASGHGGCNRFTGEYVSYPASSAVVFGRLASTRMACPALKAEQEFFKFLQDSLTYRVQDDTLTLTSPETGFFMRFTAAFFP